MGFSSSVQEEARRAGLLTMARELAPSAWWYDQREVVPQAFEVYLTLESAANLLRLYQPGCVPDLMQTEDYARQTLHHRSPDTPAAQREATVQLRMLRQRILQRPTPATVWAVVDESAFDPGDATPEVLRAQIQHLTDLCKLSQISLQVLPHCPDDAAAGGPIRLLRFAGKDLPDVLCLDQPAGALYPTRSPNVWHYARIFAALSVSAEPPAASIAILRRILKRL
jgi:hypothetical protein